MKANLFFRSSKWFVIFCSIFVRFLQETARNYPPASHMVLTVQWASFSRDLALHGRVNKDSNIFTATLHSCIHKELKIVLGWRKRLLVLCFASFLLYSVHRWKKITAFSFKMRPQYTINNLIFPKSGSGGLKVFSHPVTTWTMKFAD